MDTPLQGKVALVTGGSKGIGYSVAQSLIEQGCNVGITGRNAQALQEAATRLNAVRPGSALALTSDVRSFDSQKLAVQQLLHRYHKIDIVVANAGVGHFADVETLTLEQWQETIDVNLTGVFYTLKASLQPLKDSSGYFITIASLAGVNFFEAGTAYNASKFGLVGFSQAAMLDLRKHNIKTTVIMPGSVATYFNNHVPNEQDAWKIQPEDIGQIVVDCLRMHPRTLPSKIEVRPSFPSRR